MVSYHTIPHCCSDRGPICLEQIQLSFSTAEYTEEIQPKSYEKPHLALLENRKNDTPSKDKSKVFKTLDSKGLTKNMLFSKESMPKRPFVHLFNSYTKIHS